MYWLAVFLLVPLTLLLGGSTTRAASQFGTPVEGHHVYDLAAVLTTEERMMLESRAAAIEASGAPVVVYLRLRSTSFEQTVADARALMDAWDVQSAPGARDGIVLFFNLKPNDPKHGHFAIVAGEAHVRSGTLDQQQLERISETMLPLLRDGQLATGIAQGLDEIHRNLTVGPPPSEPNAIQRLARRVSGLPLNLAAGLASLVLAVVTVRLWTRRPRQQTSKPYLSPTLQLPSDLAPAIAGALARGTLSQELLTATVLDLARRGALSIEPTEQFPTSGARAKPQVALRLLDPRVARPGFERLVWDALATRANGDLVPAESLSELHSVWPAMREALLTELVARGWFNPELGRLRTRLIWLAVLSFTLTALALLIVILAEDPIGMIGTSALLLVGMGATGAAASIRLTTSIGESEAAPWRALRAGLEQAQHDPTLELDFDSLLPYAIALGAHGAVDRRLREASRRGYAPAWFVARTPTTASSSSTDFYPFWTSLRRDLAPSSSSDGGGSASGGSAAAGGSF